MNARTAVRGAMILRKHANVIDSAKAVRWPDGAWSIQATYHNGRAWTTFGRYDGINETLRFARLMAQTRHERRG